MKNKGDENKTFDDIFRSLSYTYYLLLNCMYMIDTDN